MADQNDFPVPGDDPLSKPFWDAVTAGSVAVMRCTVCGHAWLPARSECPHCLAPEPVWEAASGGAKLISWVVYHMAYHPAFADRLPYSVAIVELDEGARMVSNIVGVDDHETLRIDQRLVLKIETEGEVHVPRFTPA